MMISEGTDQQPPAPKRRGISDETRAKLRRTKAAGDRFEKRIMEYLESLGFHVERALGKLVWIPAKGPRIPGRRPQLRPISMAHDFLGCADLFAVHPERQYTLFVQATRHTAVQERKDNFDKIAWNIQAQNVQIWQPQEGIVSGMRALVLGAGIDNNAETIRIWTEHFFRMKAGIWPTAPIL